MGEIKDKSLLENKEFLRELMVRMMTVNKFEEVAFWLFGEGLESNKTNGMRVFHIPFIFCHSCNRPCR